MKKSIKAFIILIGTLVLIAGTASATSIIPDYLAVDFRDWSGANGENNWAVGLVTATATDDNSKLFQDSIDGLGIQGGEWDEIDSDEILHINISGGMNLSGVWLTDLFWGISTNDNENFHAPESGYFIINSLYTIDFTADNSQIPGSTNGELWVSFGETTFVNTIDFYADASSNGINNEYSVAGFTPVPEPATMLLFGIGLIGLAGLGRKK